VFGTASGTGKTSLFVTDVCAGTARVEDSKKEINYLEHPPQDEIQPGLIDPDLYKPKKDLPKSKAKKTKRPL
jgi:predicted ATPase